MKRKYWTSPKIFTGEAGVQIGASALIARRPLSAVYRVRQIAFTGGSVPTTIEELTAYRNLHDHIRSLVGKTLPEWNDAAIMLAWKKSEFRFRPAYTPPEKPADDGFAGSMHIGGVKFIGEEGVSIRVVAHTCPGPNGVWIVDDVRVTHVDPDRDLLSFAQRAEVRRLTRAAKGLVGMTRASWRSLGPVYHARKPEAQSVEPEAKPEHRTPSNTLGRVMREMRDREQFGLGKYGTTVDRTDLSVKQWLQHAKEEAMDSVLYLDRLIQEEEAREADPARPSTRPKWAQPCPIALYTGLRPCHHDTTVTLPAIWTEAFGHPVTDVRTPLGYVLGKVAPPTNDFFDTRLSA